MCKAGGKKRDLVPEATLPQSVSMLTHPPRPDVDLCICAGVEHGSEVL